MANDQSHKFTNNLINETSPYLLQHAHNPVNWYPWGEEALSVAKKENKPILVSIGYSSCHWCHVMERESFENTETAKLMNENFVNIKIDREERPDLDHIYMDAVQAMTGSGGWPLNVFLTPDRKPFYGGTYFPPQKAFNRPSWKETLLGVSQAFAERRNEIDAQAENLTEHLVQSNSFGINQPADEGEIFSKKIIDEAFENIMKSADREWGGFGRAPKFPQTFSIQYLLRYYSVTKKEEALRQALLSIDKMIDGGIYDQVAGGFARYSTDTEWLAPHFEKMLYDNALLIAVISEAYQLTGEGRYKKIIEETVGFIRREMMDADGGFYSALDADSEGEEGKFYTWNYEEVKELLKDDADIFCSFFDITENGNWEHKNIPRRKTSEEKFCREKQISLATLQKIISKGKMKLSERRNKRVHPGLDDKILLGWNALMNTALSKAFAATGDESFRQQAVVNMKFLFHAFSIPGSDDFFHTYKNNTAKYSAFLDDKAYLIQALIQLHEITGETEYLLKAKKLAESVLMDFSEEETGFFFYTAKKQQDVIVRKKEVYDGAQPSGNAVMADNLYRLSLYFDLPDWRKRAESIVASLGRAISRYPTSFGVWAGLLLEMVYGTNEIAIVGEDFKPIHKQLISYYIPHKIIMCSELQSSLFPLLADKKSGKPAFIYLCRNYTCLSPTTNIPDFLALSGNEKS